MKIYAPVSDFNGWRNNVRFVNGVAETDNPQAIEWFKARGYNLESTQESTQELRHNLVIEPQNDEIDTDNDEVVMMGYADKTPKFEDMTPNELREWAKANGFGNKIKNTRNKEKLIEILRG